MQVMYQSMFRQYSFIIVSKKYEDVLFDGSEVISVFDSCAFRLLSLVFGMPVQGAFVCKWMVNRVCLRRCRLVAFVKCVLCSGNGWQ